MSVLCQVRTVKYRSQPFCDNTDRSQCYLVIGLIG
jgi:hypothetical protein